MVLYYYGRGTVAKHILLFYSFFYGSVIFNIILYLAPHFGIIFSVMTRFITFSILFVFWLLWSGLYDPFHITLGVISCSIVVFWSGPLFIQTRQPIATRVAQWVRFEIYSVWLVWQIVLANLQVFRLAFHHNLLSELQPQVVTFNTTVQGDVPRFVLAQSITLTPGTVTIGVHGSQFRVHALNSSVASGVPGDMQHRVHRIFQEEIAHA